MANVDAAFGFVPIRHLSASGSCRTNKYTIASGLAENIFSGDLCIIDANGQITPHTATEVNNIADVVAGAGSTVSGRSGFEISGTMASGTATCKIMALHDAPDNAFGANAVMEVLINEHLYKDSAGI